MQLTFNIPDAVAPMVLDAWSVGWTEATGMSKAEYAKRQIARTIKQRVVLHESDTAAAAAAQQAGQAAETSITIT